jgi:hypothetical protein
MGKLWWQTLYVGIKFNVETNNITLLVPLVERLAKSSILTLARKTTKKFEHVNLENPCWLLPILLNTCVYSFLLNILLFWVDKMHYLFIFYRLSPQDMNDFFKRLVELIFVNMKLMRTFLSIVNGKNMTFKELEVESFSFCNMWWNIGAQTPKCANIYICNSWQEIVNYKQFCSL